MARQQPVQVAAQLLAALLADGEDLDRLALGEKPQDVRPGETDDRGIEAAAEAALGGGDDQQMHLGLAGAAEQPRRRRAGRDAGGEVGEHRLHPLGVGPRRLGGLLGAAKLGRRHHLHRLGDLARGLHAGDADLEVLQARHGLSLSALSGRNGGRRPRAMPSPITTGLVTGAAGAGRMRRSWPRPSGEGLGEAFDRVLQLLLDVAADLLVLVADAGEEPPPSAARSCASSPFSNRPTSATGSLSR